MLRTLAACSVIVALFTLVHCGDDESAPETSGTLDDGGTTAGDATMSDGESEATALVDAKSGCTSDVECEDNQPCTDDRCDENGTCVHANNEAICDDDLFCNGLDHCKDGACIVHAGDPCVGGAECASLCDETGNTCNKPAGTDCGTPTNPCSKTTCDGNGACVGNKVADGTNCGGKSTICCNGNCITVNSVTNCGGCGITCAGSSSCISVASSGVYACGCESTGCPPGQGCLGRAGPDLCQCSSTSCTGDAGTCANVVGSQGAVACTY